MKYRYTYTAAIFGAVSMLLLSTETGRVVGFQPVIAPQSKPVCSLRLGAASPKFRFFDSFSFPKSKALSTQEALTTKLLEICQSTDNVATKREKVEAMLDDLAAASPITKTAQSPKLSKEWKVIWTTEKEINLFLDRGWANDIFQRISRADNVIENSIPFVSDKGSLDVLGTITPSEGCRTEFTFTEAKLTLANPFNSKQKFLVKLPPVGKGWFDTLYLDDTLRVDINSRDDILVCRCL